MITGQGFTFLAVALQSVGKVLYGTLLTGVSTASFLLVSFCLTAGLFLAAVRFRFPDRGRAHIVAVNVWTAVTFVCFFFALKLLAPASVGSIEVGAAVLAAVIAAGMRTRAWPRWPRMLACVGIVGGCAVLAATEIEGALARADLAAVVLALGASATAGVASSSMATTFKKLAEQGWSSASILAHRFYLTIAVALAWLLWAGQDAVPAVESLPSVLAIGALGVLLPLLLMQLALRRTDALTVMICMAFQPVMSFVFSLLSPAYAWSTAACVGVLVVTAALSLDVMARRGAELAACPPPRAGLAPRH